MAEVVCIKKERNARSQSFSWTETEIIKNQIRLNPIYHAKQSNTVINAKKKYYWYSECSRDNTEVRPRNENLVEKYVPRSYAEVYRAQEAEPENWRRTPTHPIVSKHCRCRGHVSGQQRIQWHSRRNGDLHF